MANFNLPLHRNEVLKTGEPYTPSFSGGGGVTTVGPVGLSMFERRRNIVIVSGVATLTFNGAGGNKVFRISLPVDNATTFSATSAIQGNLTTNVAVPIVGNISGNVANQEAFCFWVALDDTASEVFYQFVYTSDEGT